MLGFLEDRYVPGSLEAERNRFAVSLLPYEQTTTYRRGAANAPEAIVRASGHVELFDETMKIDASRHGVVTLRPEISDLDSVTAHVRRAREEHPLALHGFLGGEHSLTPAILAGLDAGEIGIVWLDAHADLRRSFYGREDNHACAGHNSLAFGPMVQIGVRALAQEEWELLADDDRVSTFMRWDSQARDALLALPDRVYLSVDFDGFAPEVIRAVGTPEPGGLHWDDVMDILDTVFAGKEVVAFDAVELCPEETDHASDFIAARLVYKILTFHAYYRLENPA